MGYAIMGSAFFWFEQPEKVNVRIVKKLTN
jgi:hypothetical protein